LYCNEEDIGVAKLEALSVPSISKKLNLSYKNILSKIEGHGNVKHINVGIH